MKRVLIAEDERAIREFVVINLRRSGYDVTEACNGTEAVRFFNENKGAFDIAILDIMMPGVDGLEVCKYIRESDNTIGIIMLTAKTQESDKVTGLIAGADDYITKPFSPSELMARVDAINRRVTLSRSPSNQGEKAPADIVLGPFVLNRRLRTLEKNSEHIELTQVEYQIIEYFFENPGRELMRADILNHVWGNTYYGDEKVVDVNIRRLRVKVEDDPSEPRYIMTIWGKGYRWIT